MRIAAKRLRYAIELFAPGWDDRILPFAEEVAEMQASLGELHDCDIWIEELSMVLRQQHQAMGDASATGETSSQADEFEGVSISQKRRATVWLMRHFAEERAKNFSDALARWHEWETSEFRERLLKILGGEQRAVELSPLALSPAEAVTADIEAQDG
jgi:CHAD domain-containing protein